MFRRQGELRRYSTSARNRPRGYTSTVPIGQPLIMESVIETKAATILEFIRGLHGSLWVTFEEGTSAAWLYDLLKPHVAQLVVCDPRKNAAALARERKLSERSRQPYLGWGSSFRAFRGSRSRPCVLCRRNPRQRRYSHR